MDSTTIQNLLYEVLNERQKKEYEETLELNTAYTIPGTGSFRISAFRQKGSPAVVVRYIPGTIPPFDSLALPAVLKEVIMEKRGLILMVGATGSGKSTTLAAMLDYRNEQKSGHILTIEDPVEFIFENKKCIVNQREVGADTLDFKVALKNALRQAPDCILIGEVRDKDTMTAAIQYAQSGHLCLEDLSATLKSVVSQRLIRNIKGGRSAAVEVLLATRHIAELIGKGEINEIKEAMEKSLSPGSQTFEQAFFVMLQQGLITQEEALANCDSPTNMLWLINNTEAGSQLKAGQASRDRGETQPPPPPSGGETSFADIKLT